MKSYVEWYPIIIMLAIDFAFAISNILLKKIIMDGMNHLVFITYRQSISTLFLAPMAFFLERNTRPKLTPQILCYLFLSAIVGASLTQYLFLLGIQYTSATFACAFVNMVPVITFLMALPFGLETINIKDRSGRAKVIGSLICLGGAFLLTFYKGIPLIHFSHLQDLSQTVEEPMSSSKRNEQWIFGSMILFAGALLWSSWFLLQSKIGKKYPCQYSSTVIMTFFSAIQSAILTFSTDRRLSIWIPMEKTIDMLSVVYTGLIGSGLCYVGMSWCVKKRGPLFTAAFSPLVQVMAAMLDVPFLHEQLNLGSVMGSVIVIIGLYLLLWGKTKEMQKVEETGEKKDKEINFQVHEVNDEPEIP
ncbi:hypothetical protein K7X08_014061 [Anisodus acutangulus]|uniref:WAT1-related protein n=1 Tax=Anisodus acutangulus TaxID=402998 RepID=A0A9Q1LPZ0_9SOLA|nr:hypothetical protein K7X08_014061 [Anisodus acutangulus]